jgi:hypothetical protein
VTGVGGQASPGELLHRQRPAQICGWPLIHFAALTRRSAHQQLLQSSLGLQVGIESTGGPCLGNATDLRPSRRVSRSLQPRFGPCRRPRLRSAAISATFPASARVQIKINRTNLTDFPYSIANLRFSGFARVAVVRTHLCNIRTRPVASTHVGALIDVEGIPFAQSCGHNGHKISASFKLYSLRHCGIRRKRCLA